MKLKLSTLLEQINDDDDVKVIPKELQHGLVVANVNRRKLSCHVMKNKIQLKRLRKVKNKVRHIS